jgi:hypothetical protein
VVIHLHTIMAESEGQMNERQAFALANPLNDPNLDDPAALALLTKLSWYRAIPGGNTMCVILAIDR